MPCSSAQTRKDDKSRLETLPSKRYPCYSSLSQLTPLLLAISHNLYAVNHAEQLMAKDAEKTSGNSNEEIQMSKSSVQKVSLFCIL